MRPDTAAPAIGTRVIVAPPYSSQPPKWGTVIGRTFECRPHVDVRCDDGMVIGNLGLDVIEVRQTGLRLVQ
jgi:hypothetical protein